MDGLGYDKAFESTEGDSPAAFGNRIAAAVIAFGLADGSNGQNGYAATNGYLPVNEPMVVALLAGYSIDESTARSMTCIRMHWFVAGPI